MKYDFQRLFKVKKDVDRTKRSSLRKDTRMKRKLKDLLEIVLFLAERLKKKDVPGKIFKSTTEIDHSLMKIKSLWSENEQKSTVYFITGYWENIKLLNKI